MLSKNLGRRDHQRRWTRPDGAFPYYMVHARAAFTVNQPLTAFSEPQHGGPMTGTFEAAYNQQASPPRDLRIESTILAGDAWADHLNRGYFVTTGHWIQDIASVLTVHHGGKPVGAGTVNVAGGRFIGWRRHTGDDSLIFPVPGPYRGALLQSGHVPRFGIRSGFETSPKGVVAGYFR